MSREQHYIKVNGMLIEVTEEQYLCYYQGKRRMRYFERDIKTETPIRDKDGNITCYAPRKEESLDRLLGMGVELHNERESDEDAVISKIMSDKLHEALSKLTIKESKLIYALFFSNDGNGMTERGYAKTLGISKTALHARKAQVLRKLKELLKNKKFP